MCFVCKRNLVSHTEGERVFENRVPRDIFGVKDKVTGSGEDSSITNSFMNRTAHKILFG
jgi:hypothetical protein